MVSRDPDYIHGTDPAEQQRLSTLNELLNEASLRAMGLRGGEKILDVGCGLAQFTRAMGRTVGPAGSVVGIERSSEQLAEAARQAREHGEEGLVELREGEAMALPLADEEWGTFDIAHARFILEHATDPLGIVRSMLRTVRPGGRIILEDDDHDVLRLWPEPAGFYELWQAYIRSYEKLGFDPFVGRHLVSLLHESGAEPARNTWMFFGGCSGSPSFEALVANFVGILEGARENMISSGLIDPSRIDDGITAFNAWGLRPEAAMWYATCWAEGIRPG